MLPHLDTARLLLRPRTLDQVEACIAMDRDPDVTRHIPGPWHDPVAHRRFVEERTTHAWPTGLGYWSIFERHAPERFVGWVLLIPEDAVGPDVEIGWRLVRDTWGRGIASEAALAVVHHAFDTVGLTEVVAGIAERNAASRRVAEKLGMRCAPDARADADGYVRYQLVRAEGA
ncbi:GNAT family N-acetyltransferase [Paraburkholderia sp.]|uniref:GNAT family N-acetyltransferase n=1 Tax=Paraburkholderia sp. TaxID=1926495 RepID=UPI003D6F83EC